MNVVKYDVKKVTAYGGEVALTFSVIGDREPEVFLHLSEVHKPRVQIDDVVDAIIAEHTVFKQIDVSGSKIPDAFLRTLRERQVTVQRLKAKNCPNLSASALIEFATQTKGMKELTVMRCEEYQDLEFALNGEEIDLCECGNLLHYKDEIATLRIKMTWFLLKDWC